MRLAEASSYSDLDKLIASVYAVHRCLQAWAYQGNAQVDDACCISDFIKIRFSIVEN